MNNATRTRGLALILALLGMAAAPFAAAQIKAADGWARATTPGATVGAAYLTLTNSGGEERKLLRIVSPVSDAVSLHRTSMTAQGVSRMWPLAVLAVEPGQTLRMEPGGVHVMFTALKQPLVAGQKVPLTMKFDGGEPEFTVLLEVRPLVPGADEHAQHAADGHQH